MSFESFAKLGFYAHACAAWDGLVIDEHDPEFTACSCFHPSAEILALQDKLSIDMDKTRGMLPPGETA